MLIPCRWWALWEAGDREVQDGIIQLAMVKLAARTVGNYETNSFLAALSVRLMLDFEPRRVRATEMENLMVAGILRGKCHTRSSRIRDFIDAIGTHRC